jgi:hypothetical protein
MRAGQFNMDEYLEKLNEEAEKSAKDGNLPSSGKEGMIIPEENKKSFSWLKSEYQKAKVEVKVEMKLGNAKFEPGYDFTGGDPKSVKDFKPSMLGAVKTGDTSQSDGGAVKKTETPKSPANKKEGVTAEEKDPKGKKEADDTKEPKSDKSPKVQQLKLDAKAKKDDKK